MKANCKSTKGAPGPILSKITPTFYKLDYRVSVC